MTDLCYLAIARQRYRTNLQWCPLTNVQYLHRSRLRLRWCRRCELLDQPTDRFEVIASRITSYNVCYTKLLRSYGPGKSRILEDERCFVQCFLPSGGNISPTWEHPSQPPCPSILDQESRRVTIRLKTRTPSPAERLSRVK